MRKLVFAISALAGLLLASAVSAHADRFWSGVAVGAGAAILLQPPRTYYAPPQPYYGEYGAPMYYQPYGYAPPPRMCWDHWRQDAWGTHYLGRTCQ